MDILTSAQLGSEIYKSCLRATNSFWEQNSKQQKNKLHEQLNEQIRNYRTEIDIKEQVILYMWAIFDLLNSYGNKYERATHFMFGEYLEFCDDKEEKDEEMKLIHKRFNEYKNGFRDQKGKIKNNYFSVVGQAMGHMEGQDAPSIALLIVTVMNISLKHFVAMWLNLLKEIQVKDGDEI